MRFLPIFLLTGLSIIFAMPTEAATAAGTFEITSKVAGPAKEASILGKMTLEKKFIGAMDGTSTVEMLTAMTSVKGSATYIALEQFTGTLDGRAGTFVLQHRGVAKDTSQSLDISVVQDSGTGELAGISGKFDIRIEAGKHFYTFTYSLAK